MRPISLTQGLTAWVDDEDFERISKYWWHPSTHRKSRVTYAVRTELGKDGRHHTIFMHREVLGVVKRGPWIDHADSNGLNNTKPNLRIATPSQNAANHRKTSRQTKSKFKGVYPHKNRWDAILCGKYIGRFKTEEIAALAYNHAARNRWGEFARLNEIPKEEIHENQGVDSVQRVWEPNGEEKVRSEVLQRGMLQPRLGQNPQTAPPQEDQRLKPGRPRIFTKPVRVSVVLEKALWKQFYRYCHARRMSTGQVIRGMLRAEAT